MNLLNIKKFLILILLSRICIGQYQVTDTNGCAFPFEYNGQTFTECTNQDQDYPWCSYTSEFKGIWKYCNDQRESTWTCVDDCELFRSEHYESCWANQEHTIRKYCVDKILDMSKTSASILDGKDCPSEYQSIKYHTACLESSIYLAKSGLSDTIKDSIVDLHNNWRMNVPVTATSMIKMYWDDDLAYVAQKHADQCQFSHDDISLRVIPFTGKRPGQNIVIVTGMNDFSFDEAFNSMFKAESNRWDYGTGIQQDYIDQGKTALHYTQILLDRLTRIGCGYSECVYADRVERFYVCNYDSIQFDFEINKPYMSGPSCQACPNNCFENKLCDCGGLECFNSGVLDLSSCKCNCKGLWTGQMCETEITSQVNDHGCSIPFIYNNTLQYDCVLDPNWYSSYFCFTIPENDGDADHFLDCSDWKTKRKSYFEKKKKSSAANKKSIKFQTPSSRKKHKKSLIQKKKSKNFLKRFNDIHY